MSHTVSGQTTNYTWDVASGLPAVLQDGTNTYVYGLGLISATDGAGVQTYFLYDGLGSTTGLTDGSGNNPVSYSYDAFGAIRTQSGSSPNSWLFTGEQRDADSSLYYLRARYYDPAIGRFLSQDPLAAGNLYAYVGNNPVNWVDPSGLWCPPVVGCPPDPRDIVNPVVDVLPEGVLFHIPYLDRGISYRLATTCLFYPEACVAAVDAYVITNTLLAQLYSKAERGEGTKDEPKEGDAFQHCFWSGLITLQVGADKAEAVTTRYEAVGGPEANDPDERAYDLNNNERGREFAQYWGSGPVGFAALLAYCRHG